MNIIKKLEEKFSIKIEGELKEILSLCKDEPVFLNDEEGRLISIDEILNAKEDLFLENENIILLVDLYNNDFLAYDVEENKFIKFYIVDELKFDEMESIKIYIDKIKNL